MFPSFSLSREERSRIEDLKAIRVMGSREPNSLGEIIRVEKDLGEKIHLSQEPNAVVYVTADVAGVEEARFTP